MLSGRFFSSSSKQASCRKLANPSNLVVNQTSSVARHAYSSGTQRVRLGREETGRVGVEEPSGRRNFGNGGDFRGARVLWEVSIFAGTSTLTNVCSLLPLLRNGEVLSPKIIWLFGWCCSLTPLIPPDVGIPDNRRNGVALSIILFSCFPGTRDEPTRCGGRYWQDGQV